MESFDIAQDAETIPRGVQQEKRENAFRIGGVYRNGNGDGPFILVPSTNDGFCYLRYADGDHTIKSDWRLSDGRYMPSADRESLMHLLPGELHQVDGKWVSSEEKAAIEAGGCGVGLSEPADTMSFDELMDDLLSRDSSCAMRDSDENPKPALTWNTRTEVDFFPDLKGWTVVGTVTRNTAPQHALQKLADTSDQSFGSAFLKA